MAQYLGVIGGSNFLKSGYFASSDFEVQVVSTDYSDVQVHINKKDRVCFVQRHAANPNVPYSPPHLINKKAIISALKKLNCTRVLGFNSTGSMKRTINLGSLVVPDDFLCLDPITFFEDGRAHVIPGFDNGFRKEVIAALEANDFKPVVQAAYFQAHGPRFETEAEIRLFATQTDIVGMTAAHEAVLTKELGLPYATVCMVDNWANGVKSTPLTTEEFHDGVAENLKTMEKVLAVLISAFKPTSVGAEEEKDERTFVSQMIHARWVVPVKPDQEDLILERHTVVVDKDVIVDILPTEDAKKMYASLNEENFSQDHVLIPGLINTHTHAGMTLLRGYSDDKSLHDWLTKDIWPAEDKYMREPGSEPYSFVHTGVILAISEMVRGGITCFNDMYFETDATSDALVQTKMRAVVGFPIMDFGFSEQLIQNGLDSKKKFAGYDRIHYAIAPHAPYTVNDDTLIKCRKVAEEHDILYHIHLHETQKEVDDSINQNHADGNSCHRSDQPMSPLDNLNRLNLIDERLIAVHMTSLTEDHIKLLAEKKANVVHCPYSNLKLASGMAPVAALVKAGVNVALGTDSTASNNSLDLFAEMKLCAVLAKGVSSDPMAVPASTALRIATYNGAKAIGMEKIIGSLEKGKQADIVAVKFNSIETLPLFNVISHLVYSSNRESVTDVWVGGDRMLKNQNLTCIDKVALMESVAKWQARITKDKAEKDENERKKARTA